ncbi:MAG: molybdopterin molybdotransferase MoeA, partial [Bacteroidota bacterium]
MPEFLTLLPPDEAREALLSHQAAPLERVETVETALSLGRVLAKDLRAPHSLPEFSRSAMDGYAVRARDTYGANESLPGYLSLVGEVLMGSAPAFSVGPAQCALIHTGGMLPEGADAVVMLEHTQATGREGPAGGSDAGTEIEILRAAAEGENVIKAGEDVLADQIILQRGRKMRPAEIGGLMALGITELTAVARVRVGLISSGDEVVDARTRPQRGQVRDVNAHT